MIVTHPDSLSADPWQSQAIWRREDVHRFLHRHHNTLKGTLGVSYYAVVLMPGDRFVLVAGDDAEGLRQHIVETYPEFLAAEMDEIKDEVLH